MGVAFFWAMCVQNGMVSLWSAAEFEEACVALDASWLAVPDALKPDLDPVDEDSTASDRLTEAALMALEALADASRDPRTKLLSSLFSYHIKATDMAFADLIARPRLAEAAASAMEVWTVRDPLLYSFACDAQDGLAAALGRPVERPRRMKYRHWAEGYAPGLPQC